MIAGIAWIKLTQYFVCAISPQTMFSALKLIVENLPVVYIEHHSHENHLEEKPN